MPNYERVVISSGVQAPRPGMKLDPRQQAARDAWNEMSPDQKAFFAGVHPGEPPEERQRRIAMRRRQLENELRDEAFRAWNWDNSRAISPGYLLRMMVEERLRAEIAAGRIY